MKITFLFLFAIFSLSVFAGSEKDSVYFFEQDRRLIRNQLLSPTFSHGKNLNSYGEVDLHYDIESGGFRRAQEAYTRRSPQFKAEGFHQVGKFRVAGVFVFDNVFEDSVANGQKNPLDEFITFYPYANKSGSYERQNYFMQAAVSYQVHKDWSPYLAVDYHKHWTAGTVDPRVRIDRFILKLKPGLTYHRNAQSMGIYALFGKADEQYALKYKNLDYRHSMLYPDRIHYMNYGYGSSVIKDSSTVNRYDDYRGLGLQYKYQNARHDVQVEAAFSQQHNKNYDRRRSLAGQIGPIGVFDLSTIDASALWTLKSDPGRQSQLMLQTLMTEGQDGNLKTTGNLDITNYKIQHHHSSLSFRHLWRKNRPNAIEIGFDADYMSTGRQDLNQGVDWKTKYLKIGWSAQWYRQIKPSTAFKILLSPFYQIPLSNSLEYNAVSVTEFIRNVAFTDYYYFKSPYTGFNLATELIRPFYGQHLFSLYADYRMLDQRKLDLQENLNPTFIPTGGRHHLRLGVRMYIQ